MDGEHPSNDTKDSGKLGVVALDDHREAGAVVLFDGSCAFCTGAVRFIARRDPAGYFRFAASQSAAAMARLTALGLSRDTVRSIILIEGGKSYLRSDASLRIARRLRFPWWLLAVGLIVPRPARDAVYRAVAAARHRIAGRSNACEVPPPEIRGRMIGS